MFPGHWGRVFSQSELNKDEEAAGDSERLSECVSTTAFTTRTRALLGAFYRV